MQADYNPRRGDVNIALAGKTYYLRPTFQVIVQLEEAFDKGILDLARAYHAGTITRAGDFVTLLEAGLRGAGHEPPADLAARMVETGIARFVEPLGRFLAHACGLEEK